MEIAALVVIVGLAIAVAVLLVQLRSRKGEHAARGTRPSPRRRRRAAPPADPMAAAVASHSEAIDARDVAVEELRLRAQANRVAAATHEREAAALDSHTGAFDEDVRQQAESHHEAAVQHQRTAEELEQQAPRANPNATGPVVPRTGDDSPV